MGINELATTESDLRSRTKKATETADKNAELALSDPNIRLAVQAAGGTPWRWILGEDDLYFETGGPFDEAFRGPVRDFINLFDVHDRDALSRAFELAQKEGSIAVVGRAAGRTWRLVGSRYENEFVGLCLPSINELSAGNKRRDTLTFLMSRDVFLKAVDRRLHADESGVLALADIDRFRRLNEAFGHTGADVVLLALARRLEDSGRGTYLVARVGADEFAVWCSDINAEEAVRSLQNQIERPMRVCDVDLTLTASVAAVPSDGLSNADQLLGRAELGIERAKSQLPSMNNLDVNVSRRRDRDTLSLETELRRALDNGELEPYFQQIVDIHTSQIRGFEALIRWHHPSRGLLTPGEFLPLAEELDLLPAIGRLMIEKSSRQLGNWRRDLKDVDHLYMSINVASSDLEMQEFSQLVRDAISDNDLDPEQIRLEITESQLMRDPDQASEALTRLREIGVGLSLDDFGTGFSSLAYLQQFPVDVVKIDRFFVRTIESGRESRAIVSSIIQLSHELGKHVVAEGVETNDQVKALISHNCDYAQGFIYSKAVTADEAEKQLRASIVSCEKEICAPA